MPKIKLNLSMNDVLDAVSRSVQMQKKEKPSSSDTPEGRHSNYVRRKDIKSGISALLKLASGNKELNEEENLFVHGAVHESASCDLEENDIYDAVEWFLRK